MNVNPILLEVFKNRFSSIAEEMGVTLNRTAFSPNIKERRDFSCAIFDRDGDMIAQAAHIPVHLGSMPLSVKSAIAGATFKEGDMVISERPFKGGTHLPDITIVAPGVRRGGPPFLLRRQSSPPRGRGRHDVRLHAAGHLHLSGRHHHTAAQDRGKQARIDSKLMTFFLEQRAHAPWNVKAISPPRSWPT